MKRGQTPASDDPRGISLQGTEGNSWSQNMPSLRSRLVILPMQYRHLFRFQLKRPVVDFNTSVAELRREVEESAARFGKMPAGIEVTPVVIDGRQADYIVPAGAAQDRLMLYFHGGGYVMGSVPAHRSIVAKFVKNSGVGALLFDYRLAPEHPHPAALEDAVAAYRFLLDQGVSPAHIVFVGDSAGAGLCLATLLAVRDQGLPLPAGAVALSPWTDLKLTGASYKRRDPVAPDGSAVVYSKYYAGDNDPGLPYISPLYGDLHGLPPLLIFVGSTEAMLDDSTSFAAKAAAAGVDVTLRVGEGMVHCYPVLAPLFPEATEAMGEICEFIKMHTAKMGALA
jgi:acetyl esterase/lipase